MNVSATRCPFFPTTPAMTFPVWMPHPWLCRQGQGEIETCTNRLEADIPCRQELQDRDVFFLATLGLCFLRRKSLICTDPSSQTSDCLGILVPVIAWWDQHNPHEITRDNGAVKLETRLPSESRESSEIRNSRFSEQEHQVMSNE